MHVVRLVRRVRDQRVEFPVGLCDLQAGPGVTGRVQHRRIVEVVGGQVGQQFPGEFQAVVLVLGLVVRDPGLGVVRAGAAQFLEAHFLPGHRLDHIRAGDEHVRGALDHQREIGDGGGVHGASGARPHDQGYLGDDARRGDVAEKNLGEQPQGDHAFLNARAAAVVDADQRAARLQRVVHQFDDLLAVDLAQRATEDGEVLAEHADGAAVDGAVPGDDAVAVGPVRGDPEIGGPMPGELVEFGERAGIEQPLHPLPGGHLALGVLVFHRPRRAGVDRLVPAALQVGDLAGRGVRGRVLGRRAIVVRGSSLLGSAPVLNFAGHSGQGSRRGRRGSGGGRRLAPGH